MEDAFIPRLPAEVETTRLNRLTTRFRRASEAEDVDCAGEAPCGISQRDYSTTTRFGFASASSSSSPSSSSSSRDIDCAGRRRRVRLSNHPTIASSDSSAFSLHSPYELLTSRKSSFSQQRRKLHRPERSTAFSTLMNRKSQGRSSSPYGTFAHCALTLQSSLRLSPLIKSSVFASAQFAEFDPLDS